MCVLDYIPFTYCREIEKDKRGYRVDFKSIVQGLIVAGVTGFISMYATQITLKTQLDVIQSDIEQVKARQHDFRKDFYAPVIRQHER